MTDLKKVLKEELKHLEDAGNILNFSYLKCIKIGIKVQYTNEELESFDSLTSRFSRLSDLIIQKIFKMIERIDLDSEGTIRDSINKAEKKGIIDSADTFVEIRGLRNTIAHEYLPESYKELFVQVLDFSPVLLKTITSIKKYSEKYLN